MKALFTIFKIIFFLLLTGTNIVSAQDYFRIIGGIPHLPIVDPSTILVPDSGMLIFNSIDQQPQIYTGSSWETLCSGGINTPLGLDHLNVLTKIPFLPSLIADPVGAVPAGAVYLSQTRNAMMMHDDAAWNTVVAIVGKGNFTADTNNFSSDSGLKISKLPVLSNNPNPIGLAAGAIYINTISKAIRYYDGTTWKVIDCLPVVNTITPSNITNVSAQSGAEILNNGGSPVQSYGICWSTNRNPDITLITKTNTLIGGGADVGTFVVPFGVLQAGMVYYVRAYAINDSGIAYGDEEPFTSDPASKAIIETLTVSANGSFVTADSGGEILSDGGVPITQRGIIWSTTGDPQFDPSASISNDGHGFGEFPSLITSLIRNTTYYVRAYADNVEGRGYGGLKTYSSPSATAPVLNTSNLKIKNITENSAEGEVIIINNGGDPVLERGIRWTTDHVNFVEVPSSTVNPSDIGTFVSYLTGLTSGMTYYVQTYAKNNIDTSYGNESSFITTDLPTLTGIVPFNYDTASNINGDLTGYNGTRASSGGDVSSNGVSMITKRGICWDKSKGPTNLLTSKTELNVSGSGTGTFYSDLTLLEPNTTYYVRAYATNDKGTGYSNEGTFTTPQQPVVNTATNPTVTSTTIAGGGNIVTDGRVPLIESGLCWGLTLNLSVDGQHIKTGNRSGSFSGTIKNLRGGTPYYIRAYATNALGVSYGDPILVTTDPAEKPTITTKVILDTSGTSVVGGGNITSDGGADVSLYGVIWSLTPNFIPDYTTAPNLTSQRTVVQGNFSSTLSPLLPNRTYYVRAYAVNAAGPKYGEEIPFKTYTLPSINKTTASSVSATSAVSGGIVVDDGGDTITKIGVVWHRFHNPTLEASLGNTQSSGGMGNFIHTINGLSGNTTYYVRAYAINRAGVAYADEDSFTTDVSGRPTVTTVDITKITGNTALGGGSITSNGGSDIMSCGVIWSTVAGFEPSLTMSQRTNQLSEGNFTSNIAGLSAGTPYFVRAYAQNLQGVSFGSEVPFRTLLLATVNTTVPNSVTSNSAISGGSIASNGGSYITSNGICWSTSSNPTIADAHTVSGSGSGSFTANLADLTAGNIYYVSAYAINAAGISYGAPQTFTTLAASPATVVTQNPSKITGISASGGGNITSGGGAIVTTRGIVWSTNPGFDPSTETVNRTAEAGYGTGTFDHDMTNLTSGQTYYVYAYAVNSAGPAYGGKVSFTTPTTATIKTNSAGSVTATKAIMGGTITNSGGSDVLKRGVIWSTYTGFTPNINSSQKTEDGTGVGTFISELKGLSPDATYYVVAYAINGVDISYGLEVSVTMGSPSAPTVHTNAPTDITAATAIVGGDITDDGGLAVGTRGVVWSTNPSFDPSTEFTNRTMQTGNGVGVFSSTITGLDSGTPYYFYSYAQNSKGFSYGNKLSFTTNVLTTPIVSTVTPTGITATTADLGGNITDDGGLAVVTRGVVWSTNPSFDPSTEFTNRTMQTGNGVGVFSSTITGLDSGTPYYVYAYAENPEGISFGNKLSFTTNMLTSPIVNTVTPIAITGTTADSGGNITDDGGLAIYTRGVVWSTNPSFDPNIEFRNRTTQPGTGTGIFSDTITGLSPNMTYYVYAYAQNSIGITYGDMLSFAIPPLATINTDAPSLVTNTSAVVGGTITNSGGSPVLSRGVLWSKILGFTPNVNSVNKIEIGTGMGNFSNELKNLRANTKYYVRAYAVTKFGDSYGDELDFTTYQPALPTVSTDVPVAHSDMDASGGGEITDDGGSAITSYGIIWSQNSDFDPSTESNKTIQTGLSLGIFSGTITGLDPGTTYYACAYASNGAWTAYGDKLSFTTMAKPSLTTYTAISITGDTAVSGGQVLSDGGTPITEQGVCWSKFPHPLVGYVTKTNDSGAGNFTSSLSYLEPGQRYYYRSYATNKVGTSYGSEYDFVTQPILASVSTTSPIITGSTTATSGGTITSNGGSPVYVSGIVWSKEDNFDPETAVNRTTDGSSMGTFTSTLSGIAKSTSYYIRAYATNGAGTAYGKQLEVVISAGTAILDTSEPTAVTGTTAISGGLITSDGGSDVSERGVCWSTETNPTIPSVNKTSDPDLGGGSFTSMISNLEPNQIYYVRAYAKNGVGVSYGLEESFVTPAYPTLTGTLAATNIMSTTANSGGNITDDGRTPILSRGIVWDTYSNPTVALTTKTVDDNTTGIGLFSAGLSDLKPNTKYYVRAYATNTVGITYGSERSFTTNVVSPPTIATISATPVANYAASAMGSISDDGGMPITERGFVWDTNAQPTTSLPTIIVNSGNGTGTFTDVFSSLVPGRTYYVRAYAKNSLDTGYGLDIPLTMSAVVPSLSNVSVSNVLMNSLDGKANLIFDGGSPITDLGLIWDTTNVFPAPTPTNHLSVGSFGTVISGSLSGLTANTPYYVWAYAKNGQGTGYSASPVYITTASLPSLTTAFPSVIRDTTAISGGTISNNGGLPVTARGVCWDTVINPNIDLVTKTTDGSGSGTFISSITGLTAGIPYYVRAYATNEAGTNYGDNEFFTTQNIPSVSTDVTPTVIGTNTATCGGMISGDGGAPITSYGICWSLTANPTISDSKANTEGAMTGAFSANLNSLTMATPYHYRAYATNSVDTAYGKDMIFNTAAEVPSLGTVTTSNIQMNNADGTATLISDGGATIYEHGLVWNTINTRPTSMTSANSIAISPLVAVGSSFSGTFSGLSTTTPYYVWAYAINASGPGYSVTSKNFNTVSQAALTTTSLSQITANTATSGGTISNTGGLPVLDKGVCWSSTGIDPTTSDSFVSNGYGYTSPFVTNLTGLTKGTPYKVRAYARNSMGLSYGDTVDFTTLDIPTLTTDANVASITTTTAICGGAITNNGGAAISSYGICWSETTNPTISDFKSNTIGVKSGAFTANLTALRPGITYYFKAYATNSVDTAYGDEFSFTTSAMIPVLSNVILSSMTANSTVGSATITSTGGAVITERGLVWSSTDTTPTVGSNKLIDSASSDLGITSTIFGLSEESVYYVRAYAINSAGPAYSPLVNSFRICNSLAVAHAAGFNGAPVSKTVTYNLVSSNITGSVKCWITQNLGSDQQAASVSDGAEASAGWYWQFNRSQGYKHDGSIRTPATTWITSINEAGDWLPANDPCSLLLGGSWRLPSYSEWLAADAAPQNWVTNADAFRSVLKLHNAGHLDETAAGALQNRGAYGIYWSSSTNGTTSGWSLYMNSGACSIINNYTKAGGKSVRCLRDSFVVSKPTVSNAVISNMGTNSADCSAVVSNDGGAVVSDRGLVWNTTGNPPTTADTVVSLGAGLGIFATTLSGLSPGATYYVWAYATNDEGTAYSSLVSKFVICLPFTAVHVAELNGAPVTKTVTYNTVGSNITGTPKCWITQNLGSDQQAASVSDGAEASAGWYWQFNRIQGYKHDGSIRTPATTWITSIDEASDWLQANDPCSLLLGGDWRLPTQTEWTAADAAPQNWLTNASAFGSVLKLHNSGSLYSPSGALANRGNGGSGSFWSTTTNGTGSGYYLAIAATNSMVASQTKHIGLSLRCLRDTPVLLKPTLSNVVTSSMTSSSTDVAAVVTSDGGGIVTARGLVWNTTGNSPSAADNLVPLGSGTGNFAATLTGLSEGVFYYIWAYATNDAGTVYSLVNSFKLCPPLTVVHTQGDYGAPVTKTVTYSTVSSSITGTAKCWIVQNLGSSQQAGAVSDGTEPSAGWYWQFNRTQGYKRDGSIRTPATTWITSINAAGDWLQANDPCSLLLGVGWRLPTATEWNAADGAPQNWDRNVDAYRSVLKLHNSGYLDSANGALLGRSTVGMYWSSSQVSGNSSRGKVMYSSSASTQVSDVVKANGVPIRCLK